MAEAWIEETLPQVLSTLTTQPFKSQFSALANNADRVQFCQAQKEVQSWVGLFVSKFPPNKTGLKCPTTAAEYREKGNDEFRGEDFGSAIQLYSKSICFAPHSVDKTASELALAYGDRSAAYFQLSEYDNALKDVNDALALGYGQFKSATKLQLRKYDCLMRLRRASEAKEVLRLMQQPTGDESDTKRWIEGFGRISLDGDKKKKNKNKSEEKDEKEESIPEAHKVSQIQELTNKGLFKSNEKMSSFSTKVAVQYDEVKGRHLIAQEDIKFGDILAVSPPYAAIFDSKADGLQCQNCHEEIFFEGTFFFMRETFMSPENRPVPCTSCSSVVFCSEECRTESANSYHCYECGLTNWLVQLPKFARMSLRMLYRAGMDQIGAAVDTSKDASHFSEHPIGHYSHVYQLAHHSDGPLEGLDISYEEMLKSSIFACLLLQLVKKSNFPIKTKEEKKLIGGILLRHLHQLRLNAFDYSPLNEFTLRKEERELPVLLDLYPLYASALNHSCKANARLESSQSQSVCYLQAARPISAGTEITVSYYKEEYRDSRYVWKTRDQLLGRYRFHCNCTECAYQIRNMPFGISKEYPYYRLSCSKCSNLMERASESGSESEIFRCTVCPLEMTNSEVKRRYVQIDELIRLHKQKLGEISEPMMTDDNSTWRYFKSIIDQLGTLLHLDSTAHRLIAMSYLKAHKFDKWWAYNERLFKAIDFLYGKECFQFVEAFNQLRNTQLEEITMTEQVMERFKRQDKGGQERSLARIELCNKLERKYYPYYKE